MPFSTDEDKQSRSLDNLWKLSVMDEARFLILSNTLQNCEGKEYAEIWKLCLYIFTGADYTASGNEVCTWDNAKYFFLMITKFIELAMDYRFIHASITIFWDSRQISDV